MKRSRIFLGATTCLLAIAGFAAKKYHPGVPTGYYSTVGSNGNCVATASGAWTTAANSSKGVTATVITSTGGSDHHHSLRKIKTSCNFTLYTLAD